MPTRQRSEQSSIDPQLARLASALGTTVESLHTRLPENWDGDIPGTGQPVVLDRTRCMELLADESVGRIAFDTGDGPMVLPVNYVLLNGYIVFRAMAGSSIARHVHGRVAFEVDQIDHERLEGWSVLVRGRAVALPPGAIPPPAVKPWVGGARRIVVSIEPQAVTGRRVRAE